MSAHRFRLIGGLAAAAALAAFASPNADPTARAQGRRTQIAAAEGEVDTVHVEGIDVVHVQGNVYMIVGAGPNLAASIGDEGTLLVDTGTAAASEKVLAAIRRVSRGPIQYILNTQFRDDHTGGNESIAKAGRRLKDAQSTQAVVLAHENVLNRMSAPTGFVSPRPVTAWPTDTFFTRTKEVYFNGEPVVMYHRPGSTDGDSFVFFRKSDVIAAGDFFGTTSFPYIDVAAGGHINGIVEGLNDIMDLTIPANNVEDGTLVIPGHGRLSDEYDVAVYRDMLTIIRDRVQDAIKRGRTIDQVKADRQITLEYEQRYGAETGPWTTEMFLDAVYKSLTAR
jgi:glyoxylase-like metal-dependent hydrolase (beta-lactamase superfamily II)